MKSTIDKKNLFQRTDAPQLLMLPLFCVAVWALLSFYESAQLQRIEAQSLFLSGELFFDTCMRVPAGLLAYAGCFLTQFFYYPALGAAIFVALLAIVYYLTIKTFRIPRQWAVLAMLPLFLLLATNTQLGYWIYYLKHPGFYYVTTLGTIVALLAMWLFNRLSYKWHIPIIVVWSALGYPLFGAYALFSSLCMAVTALSMAVRNGNKMRLVIDGFAVLVVALLLFWEVPVFWYDYYSSVAKEFIHTAGLPSYHWDITADHFRESIIPYWIPFILLFLVYIALSVFYNALSSNTVNRWLNFVQQYALIGACLLFGFSYWYTNTNFRIENKQDLAMWKGEWREVADLTRDTDVPSRQIVMNKNIALLNLGRAGEEMFTYPDGSADIDAPMNVHLTHTGGLMSYWCYGKFNFCYRWCVENAVEHGWKVEYLKHAVRSMLLQGEYTLMRRYTNILKHTLFHKEWAERYERMAEHPESISKNPEFTLPLAMCVYPDALDVDDSFIEAYLMNNISHSYTTEHSPLFAEAALMANLTRKDSKIFWNNLQRYLYKRKIMRLPTHYQEAVLLFSNLTKGVDISRIPIDDAVRRRFAAFIRKTQFYKKQGLKEMEMAPEFKEEFADTYWYFYFFVRGLKTN